MKTYGRQIFLCNKRYSNFPPLFTGYLMSTFLDLNGDGIDDAFCNQADIDTLGMQCSKTTCPAMRCLRFAERSVCAIPKALIDSMYAHATSDVRLVVVIFISALTMLAVIGILIFRMKRRSVPEK
jgi:hypothetical protein